MAKLRTATSRRRLLHSESCDHSFDRGGLKGFFATNNDVGFDAGLKTA